MSKDIFYFVVSKYSSSCEKVFPVVKQLAAHFTINPVWIDDPESRKLVGKTIKTVPAMVIHSQNDVQVFEGQNFMKLIGDLQNLLQQALAQQQAAQQQQAQMLAQQQAMQVQSIAPPPAQQLQKTQTISDATASMNARLQPQIITSEPPPQSMITNQIAATSTNPPTGQTSLDGSSATTDLGGQTFTNSDTYTMQDITGTSQMSGQGRGSAKSASENLMREREMMEQQTFGGNPQMMRH